MSTSFIRQFSSSWQTGPSSSFTPLPGASGSPWPDRDRTSSKMDRCRTGSPSAGSGYWPATIGGSCMWSPASTSRPCAATRLTAIELSGTFTCDASSTITTSNMSRRICSCSAIRYTGMIHTGTAERQRSIACRTSARRCVAYFPVPLPCEVIDRASGSVSDICLSSLCIIRVFRPFRR